MTTKTVKRPRNQARIVVTLEIELPPTLMDCIAWKRDATDLIRGADVDLSADTSAALESLGIRILSQKTEVTK